MHALGARTRLALAAIAAVAPVAIAGEPEASIALHPAMPAIADPGVPPPWASPPDADRLPERPALEPDLPYRWVVVPGQEFAVTARSSIAAARAVLTVWDWTNAPIAQGRWDGPFAERLVFAVEGRGVYLLTLDLFRGADCLCRLARSFGVCADNRALRETWRRGQFLVGCCSFPGRQHWANDFGPAHPPGLSEAESRAMDAELSAQLGLQLVRPDLPGSWPAPGKPMDFRAADRALGAFTSRGFRLALQVGFPQEDGWTLVPRYAGVTDPKWRYPRREEVVRPWAEAVARRYGRDAEFFEVYNEPDNAGFWRGTVPEFIATHRWMAEGIRKGFPGATVLSGGLCLVEPEKTGLIARGIRRYVDAVGYHSHGGVANLEASFTAMRALHAAAGHDRPVFWNTEMGYANWRLDQERMSAACAVQKLLYCWAHGNRGALLYCSREVGGPRMNGADWGFLDYTMCPRFEYGAVAGFIETFAGASFEAAPAEANGLYVYLFRRGEQRLAACFIVDDYPRPITFATDAPRAQVLDVMGNASEAQAAAGKLTVTARLMPQVVAVPAGAKLSLPGG